MLVLFVSHRIVEIRAGWPLSQIILVLLVTHDVSMGLDALGIPALLLQLHIFVQFLISLGLDWFRVLVLVHHLLAD